MQCAVCRAVGRHKNVGVSYRLACLPPPDAPGQEDDDIYWDGTHNPFFGLIFTANFEIL